MTVAERKLVIMKKSRLPRKCPDSEEERDRISASDSNQHSAFSAEAPKRIDAQVSNGFRCEMCRRIGQNLKSQARIQWNSSVPTDAGLENVNVSILPSCGCAFQIRSQCFFKN